MYSPALGRDRVDPCAVRSSGSPWWRRLRAQLWSRAAKATIDRTPASSFATAAPTIRLLGVDAPEVAHPEANPPRPDPECFGDEAAAYANMLMAGKIVSVEFDPQHSLRDDFGRLLAYVRLPDDRVANEVMIRQGRAK